MNAKEAKKRLTDAAEAVAESCDAQMGLALPTDAAEPPGSGPGPSLHCILPFTDGWNLALGIEPEAADLLVQLLFRTQPGDEVTAEDRLRALGDVAEVAAAILRARRSQQADDAPPGLPVLMEGSVLLPKDVQRLATRIGNSGGIVFDVAIHYRPE